jgi:CheY-like chemotaxis protein
MFGKILRILRGRSGRAGKWAGKKILIVDDGEIDRKVMSSMLEKHGFLSITADSGQKGMALAREEKPDLVLLDVSMPGMDGKEVCERLKHAEETRSIPIIFLTCSEDPSRDVLECYEVGADYYLRKPVSSDMLVKQINLTFQERDT